MIYKRTGNLRACQLLLGHSKLESTVRYLGIEVDDALVLSEQTDLRRPQAAVTGVDDRSRGRAVAHWRFSTGRFAPIFAIPGELCCSRKPTFVKAIGWHAC